MPALEFSALAILLVQIAAILLTARALGVVTRLLGQPLVIAEVLGGIVLGPSLLGWLWPGAMEALFPASSLTDLKMVSQIGLVLFMFLIGLELDPRLLQGRARSSFIISTASICFPFVLGCAAAVWLYDDYSDPSVSFASFLLFLGISLSVTAFPVLARILSERHLMSSRIGAITIACAAINDVTAWCILAFVVAVARAGGIAQAFYTTTFALAFILAMLLVARPFLERLGARVASREGLTPTAVAITFLFLLVSSAATEVIGIHALFGAFVFGAILPKEGKLAEAFAEKVETVTVVLLLPLFFAYSGLRTEIGLVSQPHEWLVTGVLVALATLGKFGGSALAARVTGLRWREASAIGILMNTRGLMELLVLNLGMDLGVISPTVFTMLVLVALITTFATSPVLRWVYPGDDFARDPSIDPVPALAPEPEPVAGTSPATAFTVLMCVSDATVGPGLATLAGALVGKPTDPVRLLALHLYRPTDRPSVEFRRADPEHDAGPLRPLLEHARAADLDVQPLAFVSTEPGEDICRTAQARDASLILLGAHKPLLLEGRLSGIVSDVAERCRCPVGVLVDRGLTRIRRVLVAYAGGPEDLAALELAHRMGATPGVALTLVHVVPPGESDRPGKGRHQIADAMHGSPAGSGLPDADAGPGLDQMFPDPSLDSGSLHMRIIEHASPPDAVLEETRSGYDLIILGMHAKWGLGAGMISWRRRRVLAEAPISILAVHPPQAAVPAEIGEAESSSRRFRLPSFYD